MRRSFTTALVASIALSACSARHPSASVQLSYLGPPGSIPHTKTMAANRYGVYTFESPMNYCRGTRWIISGTMAPLWPDEPQPWLVKRGTPVRIAGQEHIACGDLDDRLSMVSGDLVRYQPAAGGDERYVVASDVYSQQQYSEYKRSEMQLRRAAVQHARPAKAPAPLIAPTWIVLKYGYEEALTKVIKENVDATVMHKNPPCSIKAADYYVDGAREAFRSKNYASARNLSWSAYEYVGGCYHDVGSKQAGDGLLLFSKSEIRLGLLTAGKNDADAAASNYVSCVNATDVYDEADRNYCEDRRAEAHDIVQNG